MRESTQEIVNREIEQLRPILIAYANEIFCQGFDVGREKEKPILTACGLTYAQIEHLKNFYVMSTGYKPEEITGILPGPTSYTTRLIDEYVKLGQWAKAHGAPALKDIQAEKSIAPGRIAFEALAVLPKGGIL